jgi:hypothetical protein
MAPQLLYAWERPNIAMETKNAIKRLDSNIPDAFRFVEAKRVKQIINLRAHC